VPALAAMHAWLLASQSNVAAGSGTAKPIEHALKHWPALQRYASSGNLPIDDNPVENVIRPIAIGKKNWLFAGIERVGYRAAAIQSLFATAKPGQFFRVRVDRRLRKLASCKAGAPYSAEKPQCLSHFAREPVNSENGWIKSKASRSR